MTHVERYHDLNLMDHLKAHDIYAEATLLCLERMRRGDFERTWIDICVQKSKPYDLLDAFAFLQFDALMAEGCAMGKWDTGLKSAPADCEGELINRVLSDMPSPFRGEFSGGRDGADGFIEWTAPVRMTRVFSFEDPARVVQEMIPPASVSLEVGSTNGPKTVQNLIQFGGVARWPYGSRHIFVIVPSEALIERVVHLSLDSSTLPIPRPANQGNAS